MAFVPTPMNAKRVPKYLDLAFVDATPLTLRVASPRQMNVPYEQGAMRVLSALHEATHFVAMVETGNPPFRVMIAPNPTTRRNGNCGEVSGGDDGRYFKDEWFTTLVGTGVEYYLLNRTHEGHYSYAFVHDYRQSEKAFRVWCEDAIQMGRVTGTVEEHTAALFGTRAAAKRVTEFILTRWALIDLCATVFLIYSDARGNVGTKVLDTLSDVVRDRLKAGKWPKQNRSTSPTALRNSLPPDVLAIWRKHSPHIDMEDWAEVA